MPTLPAHTYTDHSYQEAIAHLSSLVPELFTAPAAAGQKPARRKFSLDQIAMLTAALGTPQAKFPAVLIAGTNGKGSTASTLAAIAVAAGLRTGLYTSPHLERINERIKIGSGKISSGTGAGAGPLAGPGDGAGAGVSVGLADIPDETFARLYFHVIGTAQRLIDENQLPGLPSYFELLTAIAFCYFAAPATKSHECPAQSPQP